MNVDQANLGTIVQSNVNFSDVPRGTRGVIVDDYGTGVMVQWKLPKKIGCKPLCDGFDKQSELEFLDLVLE